MLIKMQLTNIIRDVYEDARMNRIYLPAELIPNITLSMLSGEQKLVSKQEFVICNAIQKLIELSEEFYLNGLFVKFLDCWKRQSSPRN